MPGDGIGKIRRAKIHMADTEQQIASSLTNMTGDSALSEAHASIMAGFGTASASGVSLEDVISGSRSQGAVATPVRSGPAASQTPSPTPPKPAKAASGGDSLDDMFACIFDGSSEPAAESNTLRLDTTSAPKGKAKPKPKPGPKAPGGGATVRGRPPRDLCKESDNILQQLAAAQIMDDALFGEGKQQIQNHMKKLRDDIKTKMAAIKDDVATFEVFSLRHRLTLFPPISFPRKRLGKTKMAGLKESLDRSAADASNFVFIGCPG